MYDKKSHNPDKSRLLLIRGIDEDINNTDIKTRIKIMQLIACGYGQDAEDILWEEGTGMRVRFEDIQTSVLYDILDIIKSNKKSYKLN